MSVRSMDEIASLLKAVKFRRKLVGGVDEDDVWRVLELLQAEYRSLVEAQRQRYGALLRERDDTIGRQRKEIAQFKAVSSFTKRGGAHG